MDLRMSQQSSRQGHLETQVSVQAFGSYGARPQLETQPRLGNPVQPIAAVENSLPTLRRDFLLVGSGDSHPSSSPRLLCGPSCSAGHLS